MPTALLCSGDGEALEAELSGTVIGRSDFRRIRATVLDEARARAAERPDIVVVDRDVPWGVRLLKWLRAEPSTRQISAVVVARGDFDPAELELLDAGANAVLRLPPDSDWDKRLRRLLYVSVRRKERFPVHFQVETRVGSVPQSEPATAHDISESGMLLESYELAVGNQLHLAFQLPGGSGLVAARARVVRAAGRHRFGVEFTELDGEHLEEIRKLVARAKDEAAGRDD